MILRRTLPFLLLPLLALTIACGGGETPPAEPDAVYTVRGEVMTVPEEGKPGSELLITHEPIPDYRNDEGEVVGMQSMTMPFPTADAVDLAGVAPGDKVELDMAIRWGGSPPMQITRLETLPADTELDFGTDEESETDGHEGMDHEGMDHGDGMDLGDGMDHEGMDHGDGMDHEGMDHGDGMDHEGMDHGDDEAAGGGETDG